MKVVVVGGVAGGMSFAARARRLSEDAQIVVLERDPYVSFANCGLPYHLGGEIPRRDKLLLHTPATLAASLNLDVRTGHEVLSIDRAAKVVQVRDRHAGTVYDQPYDALMLATGAAPVVPPVPGVDLPQVRVLRTVPDVDTLRQIVEGGARRAVVVGAGFIGLEVAEAYRHRGLEVAVVELADQVLIPLDPEMAQAVETALCANGVEVHLGAALTSIHPAGPDWDGADGPDLSELSGHPVVVELSDGTYLPADVVLLAVGVRPESALARAAGLELNARGAVVVDAHLRTTDPAIYAVGDSVEVIDAVTGAPTMVPLAGPANRQGRDAANHLFGRPGMRAPVLGTAIVRVFDVVAAATGKNEKFLEAAGTPHHVVHLHPNQHAGYFPGARPIHLKVLFAPDGRVLGAQATGTEGVDKRMDVLATAIRAGMTVADLADLELSYAPPFGSAKDPVNMAGMIGENVLDGTIRLWYPADLAELPAETVLLDVRTAKEFAAGHLPGALNIAHTSLRRRISEVPDGVPVRIYCASGFRSYLAYRVLAQEGWDDVATLDGGMATLAVALPDLPLVTGELPIAAPRPAADAATVTR